MELTHSKELKGSSDIPDRFHDASRQVQLDQIGQVATEVGDRSVSRINDHAEGGRLFQVNAACQISQIR